MNKTMHISATKTGQATLTTVADRVLLLHVPANVSDGNACEQFERVIARALAAKPRMIVVDLSEADSVSTVVLGQLLSLRRGAAAMGAEVRLASVQPMVRRVLNICRLDRLFDVFSSFTDAMDMQRPVTAI
jgi:anti-anti-sigma factor